MSNAITFPDHDYLGDAITLTDDAPPADELQALRAQIEALTKENKILKAAKRELKEALGQYADYRNWAGKGVDNYNHVFTFGDSNDSESGWCFGYYALVREKMVMNGEPLPPNTYFVATTAPTAGA